MSTGSAEGCVYPADRGERHVYEFLDAYRKRVAEHKELPFMVDALNCAMGCIYGTGVEPEKTAGDDVLYELHKIRRRARRSRDRGRDRRRRSSG